MCSWWWRGGGSDAAYIAGSFRSLLLLLFILIVADRPGVCYIFFLAFRKRISYLHRLGMSDFTLLLSPGKAKEDMIYIYVILTTECMYSVSAD